MSSIIYKGKQEVSGGGGGDIKTTLRSRLWAYYPLSDNTKDSGYGIAENLTGSPQSYVSGVVGNCANFAGSQYMSTPLRLSPLSQFSISFWFNPAINTDYGVPFSLSAGSVSTWELHVYHGPNTNTYGFYFAWNSTNYKSVSWTGFTVNNWWHVIVEFDKNTGTISLFVNNDLKAQDTTWDTTKNIVAYNNFRLGMRADGVYFFTGKVDEFAVILGNTTQDERDWLYNSGIGNSLVL